MTKGNALAEEFFQNMALQETNGFKESFEVINPASMSSFTGMFGDVKISEEEDRRIQHILNENYTPGTIKEEQVTEDYEALFRISSEIKAINNQSILLHGERIKQAQIILKKYRHGAFYEWLISTYGNRQTPYSMLQYYDFYQKLDEPEKVAIESMPRRVAYKLAARQGPIEKKLDIIKNYKGEKHDEMEVLIKDVFPSVKREKKSLNSFYIIKISESISKIEMHKDQISEEEKESIALLIERLYSI